MAETDTSKTVIVLYDIVSNFPYLVTAIQMICLFIGILMGIKALRLWGRAAYSGVGLDQKSSSELKMLAMNYTFGGVIMANMGLFVVIFLESLGIVDIGTDAPEYVMGDIFESAGSASNVINLIAWIFNFFGFIWFVVGWYFIFKAAEEPHLYKRSRGIGLIMVGIVAIKIKFFATWFAEIAHLPTLVKLIGLT